MSLPLLIIGEYPLPDPEMQNATINDCERTGMGEFYGITREGRFVIPQRRRESRAKLEKLIRLSDFYLEDLNFEGDLKFYGETRDGKFYLYLAHFINGQVYSIEKPDIIEFESQSHNPEPAGRILFSEDIGPKNGTIFRITKAGRLIDVNAKGNFQITMGGVTIDPRDLNFHGDLKFYRDP